MKFAGFFQCFLPCFCSHVLFDIFQLGKLLLALNTRIVIPVDLNFFLIWVRKIVFYLSESTNLLSCLIELILQPLFRIIYSLRQVFHPCDNTMAILSLKLIAPYVHFLIFVWSLQTVCGVLAAFNQYLILGTNIAWNWSADLHFVIS